MMLDNGDGTFTGGGLDVIGILHDVEHGTYHPCFFEEAPMPGPVASIEETRVVRLKSKMHHTAGFATLEEAQADEGLRGKIQLPPENVWLDDPMPWDGQIPITTIVSNWRRETRKQEVVT